MELSDFLDMLVRAAGRTQPVQCYKKVSEQSGPALRPLRETAATRTGRRQKMHSGGLPRVQAYRKLKILLVLLRLAWMLKSNRLKKYTVANLG